MITVSKKELFKKLCNEHWGIVLQVKDIKETITLYDSVCEDAGIGKIKYWAMINGKEINDNYGLTGDIGFQDDVVFLAFSIDDLSKDKLEIVMGHQGECYFDELIAKEQKKLMDRLHVTKKVRCKNEVIRNILKWL